MKANRILLDNIKESPYKQYIDIHQNYIGEFIEDQTRVLRLVKEYKVKDKISIIRLLISEVKGKPNKPIKNYFS